jgi:hypothetical protein
MEHNFFFAKALKKSTHCLVIMAHYIVAVPMYLLFVREGIGMGPQISLCMNCSGRVVVVRL